MYTRNNSLISPCLAEKQQISKYKFFGFVLSDIDFIPTRQNRIPFSNNKLLNTQLLINC